MPKTPKPTNNEKYDASKIEVLQGLEAVRKRPAMYIGSTDKAGLHHIFKEVIDNTVDEAIAGFCNHVIVTVQKDGGMEVSDNGRGMPVDFHQQTKVSALETIMTNLHAGGKFGGGAYKVSGGLHGVGIKCTNALSSKMVTTVYKDGKIYAQEYSQGKKKTEVKELGKTDKSGTTHLFYPDETIFDTVEWDNNMITKICREFAYLTAGLRFTLIDQRVEEGQPPKIFELYFENGVESFVQFMNMDEKAVGEVFYAKGEDQNVLVETAIQYNNSLDENVKCYANNIINPEGGTHLAGFRAALTKAINDYAGANEMLKGMNGTLTGDDVREGLTAVISVKVSDPQFEGQTKIKLNNPEVKPVVQKVVKDALTTYFNEHPAEAKAIIGKAILSNKARAAAKAARDAVVRKGALEGGGLPGKLADCSSKNPEECELFLVEGDSAGGSAKQGRDRGTQAVLPLRGKVINTQKYRLDRVLANNEIKDIITALGIGIGETLDVSKLRYHKLILMTDADVDGQHITTLILTVLFRFFRPLIEQGYVYVAQPPLFKVEVGKQKYYFINDAEKDKFVAKAKAAGKTPVINRFKGLGEMNPDQLAETTMNKETRVLKRVSIEDMEEAEKVFEVLMGDEVPPRRRFIQTNARMATLDV
ncbi:MAG: DNA gyrase subunit B [Candidatus Dojkabacteria bacterium]|nr:MAG: DNA gyrase subunit B [Candidatus Dojkabacteria bacterium]